MKEEKLKNWLEECYRIGASNMLLVVDRAENFEIFPVKVYPHQNLDQTIEFYSSKPETEVVEVYSMSHSIDEQLKSDVPVFNYA